MFETLIGYHKEPAVFVPLAIIALGIVDRVVQWTTTEKDDRLWFGLVRKPLAALLAKRTPKP
jgi:hypothetical protein